MMSTPDLNLQPLPYPFMEPVQTLHTVKTLWRLLKLHSVIDQNPNRQDIILKLHNIWGDAKNSLGDVDIEGNKINTIKKIEELDIQDPSFQLISEIYISAIKSAGNKSELEQVFQHFCKDNDSVLSVPVQRANKGLNGPTLLASYFRYNRALLSPQEHSYVIKWSDSTEVCTTRVYTDISRHLLSQKKDCSFKVPALAAIDLTGNEYEKIDGLKIPISASLNEQLADVFNKFLFHFQKKEDLAIEDGRILLIEKLPGSNLFDFLRTKYSELPEKQRKILFTHIGELAMIDLIVGNDDRFTQINYDEINNEYQLGDDMICNLGNVIVDWEGIEGQELSFYAIDNVIGWPLIDPNEQQVNKKKYNEFIKALLSNENYAEMITQSMICSFDAATTIVLEAKDNPSMADRELISAHEQLEPFRKDLKSIAFEAIARGIHQMAGHLQDYFCSSYKENSVLQNYLYADLNKALVERFEIFTSTRR